MIHINPYPVLFGSAVACSKRFQEGRQLGDLRRLDGLPITTLSWSDTLVALVEPFRKDMKRNILRETR